MRRTPTLVKCNSTNNICRRTDCGAFAKTPNQLECYKDMCINSNINPMVPQIKIQNKIDSPTLVCYSTKPFEHNGKHKVIRKPCSICPNYNNALGFENALKLRGISTEDAEYPIIAICDELDIKEVDQDQSGGYLVERNEGNGTSACIIS